MADSSRLVGLFVLLTGGCGTLLGLDVDSLSSTGASGAGSQGEGGRSGGGGATAGASPDAGSGSQAGTTTGGTTGNVGGSASEGGSGQGGASATPGDGGAGGGTEESCEEPWLTGEVGERDLTTNYTDPQPSSLQWVETSPHTGSYSLQADLSWGMNDYGATVGFGIGPRSTTQFRAVAFWIRSGGDPLPNLYVFLRDSNGYSNFVSVLGPLVAAIDGDWRRVVVPLSEFENVDRSDINNLTLQINQQPDTAGTAQLFLDDGAWVFETCP